MIQTKVTSLQISKRLRGLGVKQESEFYWREIDDCYGLRNELNYTNYGDQITKCSALGHDTHNHSIEGTVKYYSAFLAEELGEMLPEMIEYNEEKFWLVIKKYENDWQVFYNNSKEQNIHWTDSHTLTNSMALMLEYLITNKLIII